MASAVQMPPSDVVTLFPVPNCVHYVLVIDTAVAFILLPYSTFLCIEGGITYLLSACFWSHAWGYPVTAEWVQA